jgi:S1-C subfamily serine protease
MTSRPSLLVVVHLSGNKWGTTERIRDDLIRVGSSADAELHFTLEDDPAVGERHAEIRKKDDGYEIVATGDRPLLINGRRVTGAALRPGDRLQLGDDGPQLKLRWSRFEASRYKSLSEAFGDCVDCARTGGKGLAGRIGAMLLGLPREMLIETAPWFRIAVAGLILVLAAFGLSSYLRSVELEAQLEVAEMRVDGLREMLEKSEAERVEAGQLLELQRRLESDLSSANERLESLEGRAGAERRVLSKAVGAVLFLQGAWGFDHVASGRPLRYRGVDAGGDPLTGPDGQPLLTVEGDGPLLEGLFTGTGFLVGGDGLIVTNRHVAVPWYESPAVGRIEALGFRPVLRRFIGYLVGERKAFPLELLRMDDQADLALLECTAPAEGMPGLELREEPAEIGEEVFVVGYPTGIQALLARAGEEFVRELTEGAEPPDFWTIAERLSAEDLLSPLATRGIVGQVTDDAVVYDAQTTSGGSGGPVVDLEGRILAVNTAIVPGFGGSNLGVPAREARRLLFTLEAAAPSVEKPGEAEKD